MSKTRIGVLGAGAISATHCAGVGTHPDVEITAVADSSRERGEALAKTFSIPKVYTSVEELLGDPSIEAVTIALPNYLHAPTAIAALDAGKHVHCDKPFAMNTSEAARVVQAASASGKVMMVGMNQRFSPEAQAVRRAIERGKLGEIYFAKAFWTRRSGIPKFGTWFCDKSRAGGGALLDIGVHMLDLCLSLIGSFEPLSVSGFAYTKFGHRGLGEGGWGSSDAEEHIFTVDDLAGALVRLSNGATVELEASWARHQEPLDDHNVELFGTEGGATVYPAKLFQFADGEGYRITEPGRQTPRYPHMNRFHNWVNVIRGSEEQECTLEQAYTVQRIIDAIYESAAAGREVRLD